MIGLNPPSKVVDGANYITTLSRLLKKLSKKYQDWLLARLGNYQKTIFITGG